MYNKNYLKDIEEKERDFEEEVTNIKINMGTVINSNYWRIEGIKNIYNVFQEEVSEKFEKDLSEYRIEEENPIIENENKEEIYNNGENYDDYEYDDENDYEDVEFDDEEESNYDEYDEDDDYEDEDLEYDDEYEYDDDEFDDQEQEEIIEDDGEITEEKIDELIRESRKEKSKKNEKQEKGLFGRLFKK